MSSKLIYICDRSRHLVCLPYSIPNLHKMARELEINDCWFHKDHYDIPIRRIEEVSERCMIVDSRDIVRIIKGIYNRKA